MATPAQQPHKVNPQYQQNVALVKEKLKELGPGPYTADQQKLRDSYLLFLSKESMAANTQGAASNQTSTVQMNADNSSQAQSTSGQQGQQLGATSSGQQSQILDKRALQELVKEVDPAEQLDEDVEDMLLQIADDFIENVINSSCQLAKHRKSNILEAKDVQFHLERNYNIWIPGFSTDELKPFKKSVATEAHKQRLQLIKKSSAKPPDGKSSNN